MEEKKSEVIEVRVTHSQKQRFMRKCRDEGTNASNIIRDTIDDHIDVSADHTPNFTSFKWKTRSFGRLIVASATAIVMATVFAGANLIGSQQEKTDGALSNHQLDERLFIETLDQNNDAVLSRAEFDNELDLALMASCGLSSEHIQLLNTEMHQFEVIDRNLDNMVDARELEIDFAKQDDVKFAHFDADNNGALSPVELQDHLAEIAIIDQVLIRNPDCDAITINVNFDEPVRNLQDQGYKPMDVEAFLQIFDTNKDGNISRDEFNL